MSKAFYITTTLPYVNADPHIGFAMEIVRADIIARLKRAEGYEVFFNTGTDEHGIKILQKAQSENKDPKTYVDEYASKFGHLKQALNLSYDNFIRTTDEHHIKAAQEFWMQAKKNGYIYKKNYKIKYCVGCELEKTESELVDGRCPLHPTQELEIIDEENYFFKFSEFQKPLMELYKKNPDFVIPDFRFNEIRSFVERGLDDFSISRLRSKMSWGVPVPDDSLHVMYVWFDALVNYISAIGWPADMKKFKKFWPVVQYCGKDNLRQQSAMWQAMLLSVKLPPSKHIVIDGFVNVGGQKMSKSLGNTVNPYDLVKEYGTDAVRYYIAREFNPFEDSDYTADKFKEAYNANLANGIGNLSSRIMKMAETNLEEPAISKELKWKPGKDFTKAVDAFNLKQAADIVWAKISGLDEIIQKEQPFKLVKTDPKKGKKIIKDLAVSLYDISKYLEAFLPETAQKIQEAIKANKTPSPLFLRKD
jgi:methionyl-tRNA synthetase